MIELSADVVGRPDVVDLDLVDEQERSAVVGEDALAVLPFPAAADAEAVDLRVQDLDARVRVGGGAGEVEAQRAARPAPLAHPLPVELEPGENLVAVERVRAEDDPDLVPAECRRG